jgi:hypothetical protein
MGMARDGPAPMKSLRSSAPPHSILSTQFRYTNSGQTNIAATFARARKQMTTAQAKVTQIRRKKA